MGKHLISVFAHVFSSASHLEVAMELIFLQKSGNRQNPGKYAQKNVCLQEKGCRKDRPPIWICEWGSGRRLCGHMQTQTHGGGKRSNKRPLRDDGLELWTRWNGIGGGEGTCGAIHPRLLVIHQTTLGSSKGQLERCSRRQKPVCQMLATIPGTSHFCGTGGCCNFLGIPSIVRECKDRVVLGKELRPQWTDPVTARLNHLCRNDLYMTNMSLSYGTVFER